MMPALCRYAQPRARAAPPDVIAAPRPRAALSALAMALAIMIGATRADAEPLPRAEHVARALDAIRALGASGRDELARTLYESTRTRCQRGAATPAASCLIEAARSLCASNTERARCAAAADVIITNLRAASAWVDEPTRVRLVRGSTDYRTALAAELHRRYAVLAAELVLRGTGSDTAAAIDPTGAMPPLRGTLRQAVPTPRLASLIDALCLERDRELHVCKPGDAACVPSVPWSRCVAALVWFIGGGS